MSPPAPLSDWPVAREMPPLEPALAVPVSTETAPLTPVGPLISERTTTSPLDSCVPSPLDTSTDPPAPCAEVPPTTRT